MFPQKFLKRFSCSKSSVNIRQFTAQHTFLHLLSPANPQLLWPLTSAWLREAHVSSQVSPLTVTPGGPSSFNHQNVAQSPLPGPQSSPTFFRINMSVSVNPSFQDAAARFWRHWNISAFPPSVNSCIMALGIVCPQLLSSFQAEKRSPSSSKCVVIITDSVCSAVMYTLLSYSVTDLEKWK